MKIFFITEKRSVYEKFVRIMEELNEKKEDERGKFHYDCFYSDGDKESAHEFGLGDSVKEARPIDLKTVEIAKIESYDIFFSWHCRQIFPKWLVEKYRCVNLHPSFNPYNRGWYPQVFSICNGYPAGVTIHEMDADIDMGYIICQREVEKKLSDTGKELYDRIAAAEESIVRDNIEMILSGEYEKRKTGSGNINYKKDFINLCHIDREKEATYGQVIDHLRALTFSGYRNAYYLDEDGSKIYINVQLEKEC